MPVVVAVVVVDEVLLEDVVPDVELVFDDEVVVEVFDVVVVLVVAPVVEVP